MFYIKLNNNNISGGISSSDLSVLVAVPQNSVFAINFCTAPDFLVDERLFNCEQMFTFSGDVHYIIVVDILNGKTTSWM